MNDMHKLIAEKDALLEERAKAVDNCLIQIDELVYALKTALYWLDYDIPEELYEHLHELLAKHRKGD